MFKICPACMEVKQERGIGKLPVEPVKFIYKCDFHLDLKNWRVIRTLKCIRGWGKQPVGYIHPESPSKTALTYANGMVNRDMAEKLLFEYEKPFIQYLLRNGYLKEFSGLIGSTSKSEELECMKEVVLPAPVRKTPR